MGDTEMETPHCGASLTLIWCYDNDAVCVFQVSENRLWFFWPKFAWWRQKLWSAWTIFADFSWLRPFHAKPHGQNLCLFFPRNWIFFLVKSVPTDSVISVRMKNTVMSITWSRRWKRRFPMDKVSVIVFFNSVYFFERVVITADRFKQCSYELLWRGRTSKL